MALQIRRGTTAERTARRFLEGELIYDTSLQQVFVGDSLDGLTGTLGGKAVTAFTQEDAQDAIRDLFAAGTHTNISFGYNDVGNSISATVNLASYTGSISATGTITASGFNGWLEGNVFANDSTLLVDAGNGRIPAEVVQGTFTGTVVGNASSSTVASTVTLTATDTTNAAHFITFVDTATGNETVRTDTNLTYNPNTNTLTAGSFSGNLTGNVTGNIVTSNIDSSDSSAITVVPAMVFNSNVTVENVLTADNIETVNLNAANKLNITVSDPIGTGFIPTVVDLTVDCGAGNTLSSGPSINFTVTSVPDGTLNLANITATRQSGDDPGGEGVVTISTKTASGLMTSIAEFGQTNGILFNQIVALVGGLLYADTTAVPATSVGDPNDAVGMVRFGEDSGTYYIYYCTADYDGVADIWVRWAQTGTTW